MKLGAPLRFDSGVKVSVPSALSATLPAPAIVTGAVALIAVPLIAVTLNASPSASLSLLRTSKVTGVSSAAATLSARATGAWFTGAVPKSMVKTPVEAAPRASVTT